MAVYEKQEPTVRESSFGAYIHFSGFENADSIIVSVNTGQRTPLMLMLPHQFYMERLRDILTIPGVREVEVMPVRSADWVKIPDSILEKVR